MEDWKGYFVLLSTSDHRRLNVNVFNPFRVSDRWWCSQVAAWTHGWMPHCPFRRTWWRTEEVGAKVLYLELWHFFSLIYIFLKLFDSYGGVETHLVVLGANFYSVVKDHSYLWSNWVGCVQGKNLSHCTISPTPMPLDFQPDFVLLRVSPGSVLRSHS